MKCRCRESNLGAIRLDNPGNFQHDILLNLVEFYPFGGFRKGVNKEVNRTIGKLVEIDDHGLLRLDGFVRDQHRRYFVDDLVHAGQIGVP